MGAALACGGGAATRAPAPRTEQAPPEPSPPGCVIAGVPASEIEGEQGLWVERRRDSLTVHWLTSDSVRGIFDAGGRTATTPAGRIHRAAVRAPGSVILRYGAPGRLHETAIDPALETGRAGYDFPAVDSLFLVGDVHGEYDNLTRLLANAGVVNRDLRWSAGRAHLVFAGDLIDRGPEATRVLWFVRRLERDAARAGGGVHVVLGNHEIMEIAGDARYLHPREARLAACYGVPYQRLLDPGRSVLGRWLATRPGILRIGDVLVVHGGITPRWAETTLQAFDDSLAVYMHEHLMTAWFDSTATVAVDSAAFERRRAMFWGPETVFWNRDYVESDTLNAALAQVLGALGARVLAVGHTPIPRIEARYGGRLLALNTSDFASEMVLIDKTGHARIIWRYTFESPPRLMPF